MTETQANINYPVYLGIWTNWSLGGRISGSTITMSHHNGAILTAFLAVFIAFTGSKFWRITCFFIHQLLLPKSDAAQDGLYHQRQAILRNATDEKIGFLTFCRILWAWRRRAHQPFNRMIPAIGISLIITVGFILASIFSSRISSSMGNEVLIASPDCGIAIPNPNSSALPTAKQSLAIYDPWISQRLTSYANYAQRCYLDSSGADSTGKDSCTPFVKRKLSSTINRNASCPFDERICRNQDGNIMIDTGYLDSQAELGLNTPADLRFKFRKTLQCAPLKSENYQKIDYYSQDKPYMQYFYGTSQTPLSNRTLNLPLPPFTHEVEQMSAEEMFNRYRGIGRATEYSISTKACYVYNESCDSRTTTFIPIQELAQVDGDVSIFFLSANGIFYTEPVDDEFYAAHRTTNYSLTDIPFLGHEPIYLSDEPASVLACKEQYQSCDPNLPPERCSPLNGVDAISFAYRSPATKWEMALFWGLGIYRVQDVVQQLQSVSLTARFSLNQGTQGSLPANQWQREVENWHNILLATFQGSAVIQAVGPGSSEMLKYFWTKPNNDVEGYLCKNQKIIATAYTNFSAMWLFIILIIGILIIFLESAQETIVVWLESRNIIKTSSTEWFSNDTLQLQRMAHEELGLGEWECCRGKAVPVTQKGQLLGVFNTTDPEHPTLVNPSAVSEKPENPPDADQCDDQQVPGDGSETEVNGNSSSAPQGNIQSSASHNNTGDSTIEHQDNNHSDVSHSTNSNFPLEPQDSAQPQSTLAGPVEGQAVTQSHPSEQHPTVQSEARISSTNASVTELDISAVRWSANSNAVSEV